MKHVDPAGLTPHMPVPLTPDDRTEAGIAFLAANAPKGWLDRILDAKNFNIGDKGCCALALAFETDYVSACNQVGLDPLGGQVMAMGFQMVTNYTVEQDTHGDIINPEWLAEVEVLNQAWERAIAVYALGCTATVHQVAA